MSIVSFTRPQLTLREENSLRGCKVARITRLTAGSDRSALKIGSMFLRAVRSIAVAVIVVACACRTEAVAGPHVARGGPRVLPLGDAVVSPEFARRLGAYGYQV